MAMFGILEMETVSLSLTLSPVYICLCWTSLVVPCVYSMSAVQAFLFRVIWEPKQLYTIYLPT